MNLYLLLLLIGFSNANNLTRLHHHPVRKIVHSVYTTNIDKYNCIVKITLNFNGWCTGTFINSNTLLTAAHCLLPPEQKLNVTNKFINTGSFYGSSSILSKFYSNSDYRHRWYIIQNNKGKENRILIKGDIYISYIFNNFLDVAYIKFDKFNYKCQKYFNVYNGSTFPNHKILRTCGYGTPFNKQYPFEYTEINIHKVTDTFMHGYGINGSYTYYGDSGSPVFREHNHTIEILSNNTYGLSDLGKMNPYSSSDLGMFHPYTIFGINVEGEDLETRPLSIMNFVNADLISYLNNEIKLLKYRLAFNNNLIYVTIGLLFFIIMFISKKQ